MAPRASLAALLVLSLLAPSCGGGGGGTTATFSASAGADRTVTPFELLHLQGSTSGGALPRWSQVSGPPVTFVGPTDSSEVSLVAPQDPGVVVLRLAARVGGAVRASDDLHLTVDAPPSGAQASLRRRILVNGGGAGRATRADHDASTQRLFVLDDVARTVLAYDVSNPDAPFLAGFLLQPEPKPGFLPGRPVDVVAQAGVLAVVHEGELRQVPGRVVFYDPLTLAELSSWSTGAGPIDADIAADGSELVVASAGDLDENALADPRGTITWIRVPAGGPATIDPLIDARTVTFSGFDQLGSQLLAAGVRLPRSGVDVSQDLEPRAVTFAPDGEIWVSLAANNALARLERPSFLVRDVIGLPRVDWSAGAAEPTSLAGARPVPWAAGRPTALTAAGQEVLTVDVAGVLDVTYGANADEAIVEVVSARGPVLPAQDTDGDPELERPFVLAGAGPGPRLLRLAVSARTGVVELLGEVTLRSASGPLTDLPNLRVSAPGLANHDPEAVDLLGQPLGLDPYGMHVGDAVRLGTDVWVADHYRPSLAVFDASGLRRNRYVPAGANGSGTIVGTETLPGVYAQRVTGGGFEGVSLSPDTLGVLAILGAPLDNPDLPDDATSRASRIVRILDVSRMNGQPRGEFVYVLERAGNVVRDIARGPGGRLTVLEADPTTGAATLFRISLEGATDLLSLGSAAAAVSAALEGTAPEDLGALAAPVTPASKVVALDLGDAGFDATALLGADFGTEFPVLLRADRHGLDGAVLDTSAGVFTTPAAAAPATVTLFGARGRQLDASDADGGVTFGSAPVQGLRQALDLVAIPHGASYLLAGADGGLARVLGGVPGYDETTRVSREVLDTLDFPNATALQESSALGPLRISSVDGDLDGDSMFDRLVAFGGRSVFLTRPDGGLAWDSGDGLDRRVFARQPGRRARLDDASPLAGAAPTCLALADLPGGLILAVGLDGSGSVALLDLADRAVPRFAGFAPTAPGARPSDLDFVPAADAPGGRPILVLVDRANGAVELLDLSL